MRPATILLLLFCILAAGCAGGGALQSAASGTTDSAGGSGAAREPMRLHAMAVAVCPTATPAPTASAAGSSQCASQQRLDLPPIANVPGLTAQQIPGYQPSELQAAYNLPSSTAGKGETIAIVIPYDDPNAELDLGVYRLMFGLPACTSLNGCFHKYFKDGSTHTAPANMAWGAEMSIDLDMASAICPNCKLDVVDSDNDDPNNLLQAISTAAQKLHANVISNSWVTPENAGEKGAEQQLDKLGAAIVAAAGDQGYGVAWPAAARGVIAVGGTTLVPDKNAARGYDETVWSGTGGGCSAYIPKPSWQSDKGCANRTVNDVAAIADPNPGVAVYDSYLPLGSGGWLVFGGTSVATPIVAATIALAGNSTSLAGASYIASHASKLNPIVGGSNGTCSTAYLCTGQPGYNSPAGFGSPNGVAAF
ncbi:MAG TPA: S53 family peptidase [Candidatus Baltobacteraceae bacterium]|jgi:subtilase family serine protease|nr:S53 family peptidase [Candidatus Baltobacteraceae bacterium]